MDYLALFVTAKIMHIKIKNPRLTASAVIGALYSVLIIAFSVNSPLSVFLSILISVIMTKIAFGKQKALSFVKNTIVFYIVNFSLGGGITAICNLLNMWKNKRGIMINGTFDTLYGDLPFGLLVIVASFCGLFSLISGKIIKNRSSKKECTLEISVNNNTITTQALMDSGNLLKEPISGKPVIVVGFETMRSIIPMDIFNVFKNKDLNISDPVFQKARIRFIPATTVGGQGLLLALSPDHARVDEKEIDAYIAIDTQNKEYDGYSAIVPQILLQ